MAIDNLFDQVDALIASDERQALPEKVEQLLKVVVRVPGAGPLVSLIRQETENQKAENADLMLRTAWSELRRVSFRLDQLSDEFRNFVQSDEMKRLIADAVRKAEDLRDRGRVERIGKILSHAVTVGPIGDLDRAEDLMRAARDLADADVLVLQHMNGSQFNLLTLHQRSIDVDEVNRIWQASPLKVPGLLPADLDSVLLKLQGLGLVIAVERRNNFLGPNERPYALLRKGAEFVRYAEGAVFGAGSPGPDARTGGGGPVRRGTADVRGAVFVPFEPPLDYAPKVSISSRVWSANSASHCDVEVTNVHPAGFTASIVNKETRQLDPLGWDVCRVTWIAER